MGTEIEETLKERQKTHGSFAQHATIAQELKQVCRGKPGAGPFPRWTALPAEYKEAIDMILNKVARILAGDPDFPDHWHDIGGYASLGEKRAIAQQQKLEEQCK